MAVVIRDQTLSLPIIQGGMGIGVSLGGLAGAVAALSPAPPPKHLIVSLKHCLPLYG